MKTDDKPFDVAVVGAGIAGLLAAETLASRGLNVVVVDKGRGVGGRLATRRLSGAVLDHGVQSFSATEEPFAELVSRWIDDDALLPWQGNGSSGSGVIYRGKSGMTSLPKHLTQGLDVRVGARVTGLTSRDQGWELTLDPSHQPLGAEAVILTAPLPQALALSRSFIPVPLRLDLEAVTYEACLTLLAVLDGPSRIPPPGRVPLKGPLYGWITDNHQKGISPVTGLTIQAGSEFSAQHYHDDPQVVESLLLTAVTPWLGSSLVATHYHRWRYAQVLNPYPQPLAVLQGDPALLLAGDAFGKGGVEGAALSGLSAARWLLDKR
jgi:predicted NAD/FAD-dependent oxidoreductase